MRSFNDFYSICFLFICMKCMFVCNLYFCILFLMVFFFSFLIFLQTIFYKIWCLKRKKIEMIYQEITIHAIWKTPFLLFIFSAYPFKKKTLKIAQPGFVFGSVLYLFYFIVYFLYKGKNYFYVIFYFPIYLKKKCLLFSVNWKARSNQKLLYWWRPSLVLACFVLKKSDIL